MPVMPLLVSTSTTRKPRLSPKAWPFSHGVFGHGTRSIVVRTAVMVRSIMEFSPAQQHHFYGQGLQYSILTLVSAAAALSVTANSRDMVRLPWQMCRRL